MNELLLVVAGIFLLCMIIGANRGFIRIVAALFTTLLILVAVVVASPYVSQFLKEHTPLEGVIQEKCENMLTVEGLDSSSREGQISIVEHSELPGIYKDLLLANNNTEVYESLGVTTFVEYVTAYFTKLSCDIIAFLVTFLVATAAIRTILYILNVIGDLPLIGGLNRLAGGVVGIGTGLIVVWILFIAITLLYDLSISKLFLENIEESPILQFLYNNNILMNYITKFRA